MKKTDSTALLFDLAIFSSRKSDLLSIFEKWLNEPQRLHVVYTPNPEQIVQSRGNKQFLRVLKKADLLLPDGIGLVIAAKFLAFFNQTKPLAEKIAGVEIVKDLLNIAHQRELGVLVIGGRDYSSENHFFYRGAKINWTFGYKQALKPTVQEEKQLEIKIKEVKPDIVFVAFGAPTQELWIEQHRVLLAKNKVKIVMTVGGSFDYLLNKVSRAPYWLRKLGLEWLFRLIIEPWRLKRQLRLIKFGVVVMNELFI